MRSGWGTGLGGLAITVFLGIPTAALCAEAVGEARPVHDGAFLRWDKLPALPVTEGLSGSFTGVSQQALLVAGGIRWSMLEKTWRDEIFVLPMDSQEWKTGFRLPRPIAHGVSINVDSGLLCLGGDNGRAYSAEVFLLEWNGAQVQAKPMPALPEARAFSCGAQLGDKIYLAGGSDRPGAKKATQTFWVLDWTDRSKGWVPLPAWPGPERMASVAGGHDGSFFLFGGIRVLEEPAGGLKLEALTDAYRYTPGHGWRKIADLPCPVAGAPSTAARFGQSFLAVVGATCQPAEGDPAVQATSSGTGQILVYHTITDTWTSRGRVPVVRNDAAVTAWRGGVVVVGGEVGTGVSTPEVTLLAPVQERIRFGMLNYAVLLLYLLGMVWVGYYFATKTQGTAEFFLGGQRVPGWAAGLSIYATMLSSITFMAIPAKSFATDWTFFLNAVTILLLAPVVIRFYLPFFRQLKVASAYEYLERRFNLAVRLFGSANFILFQMGRTAIVMFLPAVALSAVSSIDLSFCILIMGLLCVAYTVMGGIQAVIWTDVAQAIVLLAGALISLLFILFHTPGGMMGLIQLSAASEKLRLFNWTWDMTAAAVWVVLLGNLIGNLIPYTADQAVIQRYLTTKSQREAVRAIGINALLSVPSSALFFSVGTALFVFYKTHPEKLDPVLPPDAIFPMFIVQQLPAGLAGLVIAGLFAAAQSTLSSSLNSVATAITTDFYRRFDRSASDQACVRLARWVTVIVGMVGTGGALLMATYNIRSLWDLFLGFLSLMGGSLAGLFFLGIFTQRTHGAGALVGALASAAAVALVQRFTAVHFFLYSAVGIATCVLVGYLASWILPARAKSLEGLTIASIPREHNPGAASVRV